MPKGGGHMGGSGMGREGKGGGGRGGRLKYRAAIKAIKAVS